MRGERVETTLGMGDRSLGDGTDAGAGSGEACKRWRANTCARHVTPCGTHPHFTPRSLSCIHYFLVDADDDDDNYDENCLLSCLRAPLPLVPHPAFSLLSSPHMLLLNYFKPLSRCNMTTHRLWGKKCARRCHRSFV